MNNDDDVTAESPEFQSQLREAVEQSVERDADWTVFHSTLAAAVAPHLVELRRRASGGYRATAAAGAAWWAAKTADNSGDSRTIRRRRVTLRKGVARESRPVSISRRQLSRPRARRQAGVRSGNACCRLDSTIRRRRGRQKKIKSPRTAATPWRTGSGRRARVRPRSLRIRRAKGRKPDEGTRAWVRQDRGAFEIAMPEGKTQIHGLTP